MAVSGYFDILRWALRWPWAATIRSVGPELRAAELEVPGLQSTQDLTLPELRAAEVEAPVIGSTQQL